MVDYVTQRVTVAGRAVKLTPTEYKLLFEMCTSLGQALTYDQLLDRVWGPGVTDGKQRLRTYIKVLRNKLGDDARNPDYIYTVPNVGYRVGTPQQPAPDRSSP